MQFVWQYIGADCNHVYEFVACRLDNCISSPTGWLSEKPWQFKWILSPKILCKIPIKK